MFATSLLPKPMQEKPEAFQQEPNADDKDNGTGGGGTEKPTPMEAGGAEEKE